MACYGAVNCYALLSGYVGMNAKQRYTNIVYLWIQVVSLTLIFRVIQFLVDPSSITLGVAISSILPVSQRTYWYFTDYFVLFFFMPILNSAIQNLPKNLLRNALVAIGVLFSGSLLFPLPSLAANPFFIQDGYSFVWLMYLYLVGAYISVYCPFHQYKKRVFVLTYILCTVIACGAKLLLEKAPDIIKEFVPSTVLISYISPAMLIGSIALLLLFSKSPSIPPKLNKIVQFVSPLCFGVYIVHLAPVFWSTIKSFSSNIGTQPTWLFIILLFTTIFGVFIASGLVEMIRYYIFKWLKIKERLLSLEKKYLDKLK